MTRKNLLVSIANTDRWMWFTSCLSVLKFACAALLLQLTMNSAIAQTTVGLAQTPLLALKSAPGLVLLTMSRDHRLFYGAYDDTSDVDGDGIVDVGFKPSITYYGNFVSDRCYDYITSGTNQPLFRPVTMANTATGCRSGATQHWHGNWLNWATTSRMDALRRVLYGGYRVVDTSTTSGSPSYTSTILQGAYIPKDSHVSGHEFRPSRDSYNITYYTTLATPAAGKQHLFTVVSPTTNSGYPFKSTTVAPVLRYITDADETTERIWYWASADVAQGIASTPANFVKGGGRNSVSATDRVIKVEACVPLTVGALTNVREAGCIGYPSSSPTVWKPTGILHDYAYNNDALKFGLLTGSYEKNYSGGVVRRNVRSFKDEIDSATGRFSDDDGIARTIDRLTIHGWNGSGYDCGYQNSRQRYQGECKSWGAPVAEMMYEGLRFFSGKAAATPAFDISSVGGSQDSTMGFSTPPAWQNPFQSKTTSTTYGNPICSKPVQMVIADPMTSFDSDQLPGAYAGFSDANFGAVLGTNDLIGFNATTQVDAVWTSEGLGTRNVFIGQAGTNSDGNPTAKSASNFSQLRGHSPDETQFQGSYYSAGVARFGRKVGVPLGAPPTVPTLANQSIDTIAIALGSRTPRIEFPNPNGGTVSIVPISKSTVNASGATAAIQAAKYQATGAITGFYYANYSANAITAIVNFSDSEQGTDNETDAQVQYDITFSGTTVTVKTKQLDPNPGGIQSNTGFVITGTTADGLYLETRNCTNGSNPCNAAASVYYLDTRSGESPKNSSSALNGTALPTYTNAGTQTSRAFAMSTTSSAASSFIPHNPLWYAAKYGGAGVLDSKGDPTNYFNVTNPASLPGQMGKAFRSAAAIATVASTSVAGNTGSRINGTAAAYQATYDSVTWTSRLNAYSILSSGTVSNTVLWEVSALIPSPATRNKLFLGRGGNATPAALTSGAYSSLNAAEQADFGSSDIYQYLLGDKSREERKGGTFRNRGSTAGADAGSVLGDIANSDPIFIGGNTNYGYALGDASYLSFLATINAQQLAVGSNDGFFHIFNASPNSSGGGELLGFMPQAARSNIKDLASPAYTHRFFVDGAIGIGHAKIGSLVPGCEATTDWCSVAVAAGGAGAKTVFAVNTTSPTYSASSILWEINENTVLPTGYTGTFGNVMGRPNVGKLRNGTWVAIFGNGYNSSAGTANLFVVNLATGAIIKEIPTRSTILGNGLGSTSVVLKSSGDKDTIDYVYGADYKGNIWRFDLSGVTSPTVGWPANGALVYSTPTGRPITAEIKVGNATGTAAIVGGKMIYFGTGSFLNTTDALTSTPSQAIYGIYDDLLWTLNTSASVAESTLIAQSIEMLSTTNDVRTTSTSAPWYNQSGKKGWVLPLSGTNVVAGERVIAPPVRITVAGKIDAFIFTSMVPGLDDCVAGVDVWETGIDAMTGNFAKIFTGIPSNSIKITGGSPRGVYISPDGTLYISRTIFSGVSPTTTYTSSVGGQQTFCINGTCGTTDILGVTVPTPSASTASGSRQVWRQLK